MLSLAMSISLLAVPGAVDTIPSSETANDKNTLQGEAKAALVLQSNDEGIRIMGEKEQ